MAFTDHFVPVPAASKSAIRAEERTNMSLKPPPRLAFAVIALALFSFLALPSFLEGAARSGPREEGPLRVPLRGAGWP